MSKPIRISFERKVHELPLGAILPLRPMTKRIATSKRYERIATSIGVVGIVEPLVVAKADREGRHMLLDGHLRLHALQEQQAISVLVSSLMTMKSLLTTNGSIAWRQFRNIT